MEAAEEKIFLAFTTLQTLEVGCTLAAPNAEVLLATRFGDLVWLCRVLEAACETFTGGDKPAPFEYGDWRKNVSR
jgi:hypothetical protein